jgi:hypothetical protein
MLLPQSRRLSAEENSRGGQKNAATPASSTTEMVLPRTLPDFIELAEHLSAAVVNIYI